MSNVVLDASALLAVLNREDGFEQVEKYLPHAVMSAVNVSEVITVLIRVGVPAEEGKKLVYDLLENIFVFDQEQAFAAALLQKDTSSYGLSFGDRACFALAKKNNLPVFTADKIWSKVKIGIPIHIIR